MTASEQFDELYLEYSGVVRRMLAASLPQASVIDDLSQRVWMGIWRHVSGGGEIREPEAFVVQISKNVVFQHQGEQARRADNECEWLPSRTAGGEELRDELYIQPGIDRDPFLDVKLREYVRSAVEELSPQVRKCVEMHYYAAMPVGDVAKQLGISVGSVKSHMNYGRMRLSQMLAPKQEVAA